MTMATAIELGNFTIDLETSELFGKLVSKSTVMFSGRLLCLQIESDVSEFIPMLPTS